MTRTALPDKLTIGGTEFAIPRQSMKLARELNALNDDMNALASSVDAIDVRIGSAQMQMLALTDPDDDGNRPPIDGTKLDELKDEITTLSNERARVSWEQTEVRVKALALRLGVEVSALEEVLDLREIEDVEAGLLPPQKGDPAPTSS